MQRDRSMRFWSRNGEGEMEMSHEITIEDIDVSPDGELGSVHAFFWRCSCGEMSRKGYPGDWRKAMSHGRLHVCMAEIESEQEQHHGKQDQGATRGAEGR